MNPSPTKWWSPTSNEDCPDTVKDQLFNRNKVAQIAAEIRQAHSAFDPAAFTEAVMARLPTLN